MTSYLGHLVFSIRPVAYSSVFFLANLFHGRRGCLNHRCCFAMSYSMALHVNAGEGDMLSERICGTALAPPGPMLCLLEPSK